MRDKKNIIFYGIASFMVLALKLYGDRAGSEELLWILKPTAWWTSILSGCSFTYQQGAGYVNHSLRFLIAPACAGLRFWMIAALMLSCSFLHRIKGGKGKLGYVLLCFPASCLATVFVNGIRIALSIALPRLLQNTWRGRGLLTGNQLHTSIGALVYFLSLLALYRMGDRISLKIGGAQEIQKKRTLWSRALPVLWYLGPVIGLPFLSRMAYGDFENFAGYEVPVLAVCAGCLIALTALTLGGKVLAHTMRCRTSAVPED